MLRLYNSLGKKIQPFRPVNPNVVNIFTCGPSVYQRAHIGNFRTFLFEDVLVKYLQFSGYKVKRGMSITDIEDKAIVEARKENTSLKILTQNNIREFFEEAGLLKIKKPDILPLASSLVREAVSIIEDLIVKKNAYSHQGDVFFDPLTFPGFGKVYGLDMSKWPKNRRRFSRDTYPGMRWNLGDFILWHRCRGDEAYCWNTRIGFGRPAWNVQDASMVSRYFDETLSIYCGGIDNIIRHHDYSVAVVESIKPYPMSRFWLHCHHLYADGRKMSKSLGNILYMEDLLKLGYSAAEIRFFLIDNHYRATINYSEKNFRASSDRLAKLRETVQKFRSSSGSSSRIHSNKGLHLKKIFRGEMDNDLNVSNACDAVLYFLSGIHYQKLAPGEAKDIFSTLKEIDGVLGVLF